MRVNAFCLLGIILKIIIMPLVSMNESIFRLLSCFVSFLRSIYFLLFHSFCLWFLFFCPNPSICLSLISLYSSRFYLLFNLSPYLTPNFSLILCLFLPLPFSVYFSLSLSVFIFMSLFTSMILSLSLPTSTPNIIFLCDSQEVFM